MYSTDYTSRPKREAKRFVFIAIGSFCYAFFMNVFIVPAGMYSGGFMGLAQIIRTLMVENLGLNFGNTDIAGIIYFIVNIPLFLMARKSLGNMYFLRALFNIIVETAFLTIIPTPNELVVGDVLTAVIIGGIGSGIGIGISMRNGACGGGSELLGAYLITKRQNLKVSTVSNVINLIIYAIMLALFDIPLVVYSAIYSVILSLTIDKVFIQNINVEVHIIVDKKHVSAIRDEVFEKLNRGITKWTAVGAYTGDEKELLYILTNKYELTNLVSIVRNHDKDALIVENIGVLINGNFEKRIL